MQLTLFLTSGLIKNFRAGVLAVVGPTSRAPSHGLTYLLEYQIPASGDLKVTLGRKEVKGLRVKMAVKSGLKCNFSTSSDTSSHP
jgi:hypothetical protein